VKKYHIRILSRKIEYTRIILIIRDNILIITESLALPRNFIINFIHQHPSNYYGIIVH